MFEDHRAHAFKVDALIKAIFVRRLFAREKFAQLARERFVICAVALRGLTIGFHFGGEIAQSGLGLRAMLTVFLPIIRPQGEKDAHRYQRDFEEQVEKRSLSAADAHGREYRSRELGASSGREMVRSDRVISEELKGYEVEAQRRGDVRQETSTFSAFPA